MIWLLAIAMLAASPAGNPAPQHFKHVREVAVDSTAPQNYVVADEAVWRASEAALNDVRLYSGDTEVPYLRTDQRGGEVDAETPATMLNLSKVGNRAQFILAVAATDEYNRVNIKLTDSAKNFVSRVSVEGSNDDTLARWAKIGDYTLYDFSREELGSNSTLRLPLMRYKYLFLKLHGMSPAQIQGATISRNMERKPEWTELSASGLKLEQQDGNTVVRWNADPRVPLDRVRFDVAGEGNFYRTVGVFATDANGTEQQVQSGFIRRITVNRGGRAIRESDLEVDAAGATAVSYRVVVHNADDEPLKIEGVTPLLHQARFYFDPAGRSWLRLYVGDAALRPAQYDYARTASISDDAARAELGPVVANPNYTPRPDSRAWTERHPWVLWMALIVAVIVLGAVALRSLATGPRTA